MDLGLHKQLILNILLPLFSEGTVLKTRKLYLISNFPHPLILQRFELQDSESHLLPRRITKVESVHQNKPFKADVTVQIGEKEVTFQVWIYIFMKRYMFLDIINLFSSHREFDTYTWY